jgi:hypothetical protein
MGARVFESKTLMQSGQGDALATSAYRAILLKDTDKYEDGPAGVAHPEILEFVIAAVKDLLL